MRNSGSVQLEAWVAGVGGLRAAGRQLGVPHTTIRRWVVGAFVPEDRPLVERMTGVPADSWDRLEATTRPVVAPATPRAPVMLLGEEPEAPPAPPAPPRPPDTGSPVSAPTVHPPSGFPSAAAPPPRVPAARTAPMRPRPPPATLTELQTRARQIPGELQQLREDIASGDVAANAGEIMARMIEREGRRIDAAVNAMGTASVQEVEELRALLVSVTQGCEACRARVTAALRGGPH